MDIKGCPVSSSLWKERQVVGVRMALRHPPQRDVALVTTTTRIVKQSQCVVRRRHLRYVRMYRGNDTKLEHQRCWTFVHTSSTSQVHRVLVPNYTMLSM